jgi:peptidoglycan hydrolase-like protein with peptidoglycan-binding domain
MLKTRRLGKDPQLQDASQYVPNAPLAPGATGSGVAQIQDLLADLGYDLPRSMKKKGADGIFGSETQAAVKKFQQDYGLKADGLVGPKTLAMMEDIIRRYPALETPCPFVEAAVTAYDSSASVPQRHTALW